MDIISSASAILFALMLAFPTSVADSVRENLTICATVIVPSLFMFTVLGEVLTAKMTFRNAPRLLKLVAKPFGFGASGMSVFILGALCGFPYGAKSAVTLFKNGVMTRKEMIITVCAADNVGLAFMIAVNTKINGAIIVYIMQLIFALLCAMILNRLVHEQSGSSSMGMARTNENGLTRAVTQSANVMISVCACVVFFGTVGAFLTSFIPNGAYLKGLFEFSSGITSLYSDNGADKHLLMTLYVNYTGLSVHAQINHLTNGYKVYRYFVFSKLLQTFFAISGMFLYRLFCSLYLT